MRASNDGNESDRPLWTDEDMRRFEEEVGNDTAKFNEWFERSSFKDGFRGLKPSLSYDDDAEQLELPGGGTEGE